MRLDKFLCDMGIGTRSQVKKYIQQKLVTVDGQIVKTADIQIKENDSVICFKGKTLNYQKYYYYMLNKPMGVVSATQDNTCKTVMELLSPEDRREDLFPAGRLDKDTEGFLLLTNDGDLAHRLLSPRKHVDKTYLVTINAPLTASDINALEQGVDIGEDGLTKPAKVKGIDDYHIYLTIHEGKFHQVKRMLQSVGNQVTALKRVSFGGLMLDPALSPGEYRTLTEEEVAILNEA